MAKLNHITLSEHRAVTRTTDVDYYSSVLDRRTGVECVAVPGCD